MGCTIETNRIKNFLIYLEKKTKQCIYLQSKEIEKLLPLSHSVKFHFTFNIFFFLKMYILLQGKWKKN